MTEDCFTPALPSQSSNVKRSSCCCMFYNGAFLEGASDLPGQVIYKNTEARKRCRVATLYIALGLPRHELGQSYWSKCCFSKRQFRL